MVKKVISRYMLVIFLSRLSISFFFATYVLFLMSKGLNLIQVNIVNMFFMFTIFIFEIPTGSFADALGRKKSYIISCYIFSASLLVYYFSSIFWAFVLAEVIAGIASTFESGALDSYIVDSLKFHGFDGSLDSIFAKQGIFEGIAGIIGGVIGGLIGKYNLALPCLLSGLGMFLVAICSQKLLKEDYFEKSTKEKKGYFSLIKSNSKNGVSYAVGNWKILSLIIFGIGFSFGIMAINIQWQPYFKQYIDVRYMGFIWAGISATTMLGCQLVKKLERFSGGIMLLIEALLMAIGIILVIISGQLFWILVFFYFQNTFRGMINPTKKAYLNKQIKFKDNEDNVRATVVSFDSMITTLGAASGLVVTGIIAEIFSISYAWILSAIVIALFSLILIKRKK